jgi:hypothetical protein
VFPWRVRKGIRRCQGGLFVTVRKAGKRSVTVCRYSSEVPAPYSSGGFVKLFVDARGGLFTTVRKASNRLVTVCKSKRQLGASSMLLRRVYEGIRRCPRGLCDCIALRCQLGIPLAGL